MQPHQSKLSFQQCYCFSYVHWSPMSVADASQNFRRNAKFSFAWSFLENLCKVFFRHKNSLILTTSTILFCRNSSEIHFTDPECVCVLINNISLIRYMIFLTWDKYQPEWGPHTHTKLSLYMNFVRVFLAWRNFFFSRAHKILLAVYAELRKIHTRESSKGYFRGWMQRLFTERCNTQKLMNEELLCKPQIDYFLRYFFITFTKKKISPEKLPHTLQLDSILFFSDILSLLHLCWWAGFVYLHDDDFFWNYNGKFLASLFEYFFWANF